MCTNLHSGIGSRDNGRNEDSCDQPVANMLVATSTGCNQGSSDQEAQNNASHDQLVATRASCDWHIRDQLIATILVATIVGTFDSAMFVQQIPRANTQRIQAKFVAVEFLILPNRRLNKKDFQMQSRRTASDAKTILKKFILI